MGAFPLRLVRFDEKSSRHTLSNDSGKIGTRPITTIACQYHGLASQLSPFNYLDLCILDSRFNVSAGFTSILGIRSAAKALKVYEV